jgi:hypothetical protein
LPIAVGAEETYSGIGEKRGSIYDEAGGRIDDNITRASEFYIRHPEELDAGTNRDRRAVNGRRYWLLHKRSLGSKC